MVLNITGVDNQLYYDVNVALNVCFFIFLSLLPFLLCVLVILALVLAKTINIKIRVLLVNVFAVEILNWICYAIFYLGWIVRLNYIETTSCKIFYTTYFMVSLLKWTSGTLYTIYIFLFIKYGENRLKWCAIIPCIAISWLVILIMSGLMGQFGTPGLTRNVNGICSVIIFSSPLYMISTVMFSMLSLVFLILQIVMAIITFVYIKKHTLEGNVQIKKAVAKVVAYFVIESIITFISSIVPAVSFITRLIIPGSTIALTTARIYFTRLIFSVPGIATPLVAIALLKPVRTAIKTMLKNMFSKKDNRIHPTVDSNGNQLTSTT